MAPRRVEQADRAADVDPEVEDRVGDRAADVDLGGEVEDELRLEARERVRDRVGVGDSGLHQIGAGGERGAEVLAPPGGEVVETST